MKFLQAHASNYTATRGGIAVDHLVIHYTGNDGDTAENNGKYFQGANRNASAHYFVDEREIVQSVREGDTAWHAGNFPMNHRSIGIELCSRIGTDGQFYIPAATVENAQTLCRELMAKYGIPAENVIRHYDVTGKKCPEPFVRKPELWKAFLAGLKKSAGGADGDPSPSLGASADPAPSSEGALTKSEPSAWAKDACEWAVKKGIFQGDDKGDFRWQDPVTREQLAVILRRMA